MSTTSRFPPPDPGMWLLRGAQSALFYYISCAPCTEAATRKKRRKQAKRDRLEKEQFAAENPDLYRHPDVGATNPHWEEEIRLGPGPPPRKRGQTQTSGSARGLKTAETDHTIASSAGSSVNLGTMDGNLMAGLAVASDDTLRNDDSWNRRRYQRPDEHLWGLDYDVDVRRGPRRQSRSGGSSAGLSGISRPSTAYSAMTDRTYVTARAPPVNDLHPPVVSTPSPNVADNRWMLQPPPKAKIMNGKVRATTRNRSGTGASSKTDVRTEKSLSRQVSERTLGEKLKRGETPEIPALPMSRGSSFRSAQTHTIDLEPVDKTNKQRPPRFDSPTTSPNLPSGSFRKKRPPPIVVSDDSGSSSDAIVHNAIPDKSSKILRPLSAEPQRSRVASKDFAKPRNKNRLDPSSAKHARRLSRSLTTSGPPPPSPNLSNRRPPLTVNDSSLNILEDIVSTQQLLQSKFVSAPAPEARIKLPPTDSKEELLLSSEESWYGIGGFGMLRNPDGPVWDGERITASRTAARYSLDI